MRTEQIPKCCEPQQKMVRIGGCKIELGQGFYITDRSKAILLLWFHLFYVLESHFCAVLTLCTFSYFFQFGN